MYILYLTDLKRVFQNKHLSIKAAFMYPKIPDLLLTIRSKTKMNISWKLNCFY